jgi:peptidoglycan/xylan/chitin deacetylase (PgdA/CDA1 family)
MKNRSALTLLILAALPFMGCEKIKTLISRKKEAPALATPAPAAAPEKTAEPAAPNAPAPAAPKVAAATKPPRPTTPAPTAPTPPPKPPLDTNAGVMVLCYHNIEDGSKMKALTISNAEFEKELQALKDSGYTVIGMQDFLAWRRGEKNIPHKSAIITIDDGWLSGYTNAWPVLKKIGYPFTLFIYVNYVGTGGKSMSWEQLAEMRDAGVDIQCHTYSHSSLKKAGVGMDKTHADLVHKDVATLGQDGWLRKEIVESKQVLEKQLGIKVNAFAYPFGVYTQRARELVREAGYEAAFTVYGQRLAHTSPPSDLLGRYAVEAGKPKIFHDALAMIGGGVGPMSESTMSAPSANAQLAAAAMVTEPLEGSTINNAKPTLRANLASMGALDAGSIEMRVSGFGLVPAQFDAGSKTISYTFQQPLRSGLTTVIVSGKSKGQRVETKWSFTFDPKAKPSDGPATSELPPKKP